MKNKFKKRNSYSVKKYYSSHGLPYSIKEFIELEVKDRQNYSLSEIRDWIRKYKIKRDSKMLWVSNKKWIANRYNLDVDKWDIAHLIPENKMTVWTFTNKEGFIIPESCDGDGGYIFVFRRKNVRKAWHYRFFSKLCSFSLELLVLLVRTSLHSQSILPRV